MYFATWFLFLVERLHMMEGQSIDSKLRSPIYSTKIIQIFFPISFKLQRYLYKLIPQATKLK